MVRPRHAGVEERLHVMPVFSIKKGFHDVRKGLLNDKGVIVRPGAFRMDNAVLHHTKQVAVFFRSDEVINVAVIVRKGVLIKETDVSNDRDGHQGGHG